jgi:hypothetical protein
MEQVADPRQSVHRFIIAQEDDLRIRRALAVTPNIEFSDTKLASNCTRHEQVRRPNR